jgi:Tfp pilus assembly protein PilO
MAGDEMGLFEWAFKGLVALVLTGVGWFMLMLNSTISGLKDEQGDLKSDFNNHKLYSAQTYTEKSSLERIHDRMDNMCKDISDIKTLLVQTVGKK